MLSRLRNLGLRGRIGVVMFLHAALLFGLLIASIRRPGHDPNHVYLMPEPERVAAITSGFERVPPVTYPDLVRAFTDDRRQVRLLPDMPPAVPFAGPDRAEHEKAMDSYRTVLAGRPFHIDTGSSEIIGSTDEQLFWSYHPFKVIVGLSNGSAVEIQRTAVPPIARLLTNFKWMVGIVAVIDTFLVIWLAALTTVPVRRLARAVRADDLDHLPQSGPHELVELGQAFRDMRTRLHALMEERTRVIAAVAHDYRTYLTRLELRTDFIDDQEEREAALADLREMKTLLDDTLTFARQGAEDDGVEAVVNIDDELARIVEERGRAQQDVKLVSATDGWRARATPVSFRRMLANLVDNALRYGGGRARIAAARHDGEIVILIEDDGPGVPQERLEDMLQPFARLETSRARHTGGVGLGLSIVQGLAHRFGGHVRLENRPEGGLRAILTLHEATA